jgi:hypothetical protein
MSVMLVSCVNIMYWKSVINVSRLLLGNIYEARLMILGCSDGDEKVVDSIPSAYIVTSTDPSFSFRKLN